MYWFSISQKRSLKLQPITRRILVMKTKPLLIGAAVALTVVKLTIFAAGATLVVGAVASVTGDDEEKEEKEERKKRKKRKKRTNSKWNNSLLTFSIGGWCSVSFFLREKNWENPVL